MHYSKHKKTLLAIAALFVLLGIGMLAVSFFNKSDGLILTPFSKDSDDSDKLDYADLYTKEIQLGNKKINMVVKTVTYHSEDNGDWLYGEYRFYTTDAEPRLLATVGSTIPPEYANGADPFFSMKDITDDGIPEILVLLQSSASNLRSYEILTLDGDNLVNIKMRGEKSNWVNFDDIARKGRYISMTWHGSSSDYKVGRNDYILRDDFELMWIQSYVFDYADDAEDGGYSTCDVLEKGIGESEFTRIAQVKNCGHTLDDFDKYLERDPSKMNAFEKDLEAALSDPKWSALASVYKKECDITGMLGSVMNYDSLSFRPLMESSFTPALTSTGALYLFPCGMGSYETSYLVALDNHQGPTPIPLVQIDKNGGRHIAYQVIEFSYDRERDLFSTFHKPKQNATCGIKTTYKLTDSNELRVQKTTGDDSCDDDKMEDRVLYDINNL